MDWIIYYGDGSTASDETHTPDSVPTRNVQVIAVRDPDVGTAYLRTNDYYWWTELGWQGGDVFGLWDYLAAPGWKRVLFGRTILTSEFQAILRRAQADGLPRKSSRHEWERVGVIL